MRLLNVEISEVEKLTLFAITCFMCDEKFYVTTASTVEEAVDKAAAVGWHGYETIDEVCSTACPKCIANAKQDEAERLV
ncbi:conserved hypothetical protein [Shewanella halifaxensis HAW-EB4]|uniref:Uncharacterized protein n=1 Tax=Shewanella halifaxensis (strain HAW-EB4) TaxID=458817 RepID=B0TKS8_SHEHH|nr:hypothetical protein [Shewanella halifaxensis]ABZ75880.1 conserved hypothetical protein [Shewanella halifaxensis HAW-EB4]